MYDRELTTHPPPNEYFMNITYSRRFYPIFTKTNDFSANKKDAPLNHLSNGA